LVEEFICFEEIAADVQRVVIKSEQCAPWTLWLRLMLCLQGLEITCSAGRSATEEADDGDIWQTFLFPRALLHVVLRSESSLAQID